MIYKDINEAAIDLGYKLLKSESIKSTNKTNTNYKNIIGGELIQQFFTLKNPVAVIGTYKNHKGYKWWGYGEILSEFLNLNPPIMYKYKPELFSQHYDLLDDGRMQYTYSNRFQEFNQFVNIYNKLKDNPNSKRAVIDIYTPYDTAPDRSDVPCTTMYHLLHRDGKLNMSVFMRSWDFFGGFKTYDFMLSSMILQGFSSWLNMKPGNLSFYANSLHYYNRDQESLEKLLDESHCDSAEMNLGVDNISIKQFYDELRLVKDVEEASYNQNFDFASQIHSKIQTPLFSEMSKVWINKNGKNKQFTIK